MLNAVENSLCSQKCVSSLYIQVHTEKQHARCLMFSVVAKLKYKIKIRLVFAYMYI